MVGSGPQAKDLGSFAVMCLLIVIVLFVAAVVWTHVSAA